MLYIARGLQYAPRKIIRSNIESEGISRIYIGVILALAVHIIIIYNYISTSTSATIGLHLLTQMTQ